jgi:CRP-like cAMP-binding protein
MITMRQYAPGEAIIRENEMGECAYIIEKGRAEITKEKDGKQAHIAFLETGMTFGEMSMVDDLPRSATVTALEETLVREVHRDKIHEMLKENPDTSLKLLKGIFERLRIANTTIGRLKEELKAAQAAQPPQRTDAARPDSPLLSAQSVSFPDQADAMPGIKLIRIEGLTPKAAEAIPDNPFSAASLPVKIGRKSNDPMVQNHLEVADKDPLQISRHHVSIIQERGRVGVLDRGSQLGASVNGQRIGGKKDGPGPVFFEGDEGILVLGTEKSPYRYKITVER